MADIKTELEIRLIIILHISNVYNYMFKGSDVGLVRFFLDPENLMNTDQDQDPVRFQAN